MRRMRMFWTVLGCLAALSPSQAKGQDYEQELETGVTGRLVWNVGGTLLVPLGDSADRTDVGGGFAVGMTFNPSLPFGIQFEYGLDWSNLETGRLANVGIFGNSLLQYFNLNGLLRAFNSGRSTFYLSGGGGLYYRDVEVTRVEGTTIAPYCDPWLYYCSTVPVTAVSILGSRSSWDWGLDAGLGFMFGVAQSARLYAEVRYHYIFGPSFTTPGGERIAADGQYLPLTVGVRF